MSLECLRASYSRRVRDWLGILYLFVIFVPLAKAQSDVNATTPAVLKNLSLEELSQIEVTTPSKAPVAAFRTPDAIYVITGEDIRRSGATSIPEALRLAPGVEVARIDANNWAIGIRGFGSKPCWPGIPAPMLLRDARPCEFTMNFNLTART
jgi:outer membrane receptor for ferric coprogen and ferric-rhodotorulic acid